MSDHKCMDGSALLPSDGINIYPWKHPCNDYERMFLSFELSSDSAADDILSVKIWR